MMCQEDEKRDAKQAVNVRKNAHEKAPSVSSGAGSTAQERQTALLDRLARRKVAHPNSEMLHTCYM